ncbi:MAG: glycosyltransferase [Desulfuromonadales bacterium]|nr:glycosyltransferase [Desulfuromonadales bacterium]
MNTLIESGKINIAYIIDTISCDTAGTQKQLLETIKRLDKESFSVHLVCLFQSEWMTDNPLPCPCIVLGYRGLLKVNFPSVVCQLRDFIKGLDIHIVQTFFEDSIFVAYFAGVLARPQPVLISSRRDMGLGNNNQPWYHKLYGMLLPFVNRSFNGIISNSEQVRQYVAVREKVPLEKIKVIRNGVALHDVPESTPNIFRKYKDVIWIGLAASLTPVKRHDLLLQALAILKDRDLTKTVRVLLLGEGPERDTLERQCNQLQIDDVVHFIGVVRDVSRYLHQLDICVLCSDREGLSNAILEYMACGKPVIATAVGGNTELVNDQNGILVPPDDPVALSNALAELIVNEKKRKAMGIASLAIVKRQFSWQTSMAELEGYYLNMVGKL